MGFRVPTDTHSGRRNSHEAQQQNVDIEAGTGRFTTEETDLDEPSSAHDEHDSRSPVLVGSTEAALLADMYPIEVQAFMNEDNDPCISAIKDMRNFSWDSTITQISSQLKDELTNDEELIAPEGGQLDLIATKAIPSHPAANKSEEAMVKEGLVHALVEHGFRSIRILLNIAYSTSRTESSLKTTEIQRSPDRKLKQARWRDRIRSSISSARSLLLNTTQTPTPDTKESSSKSIASKADITDLDRMGSFIDWLVANGHAYEAQALTARRRLLREGWSFAAIEDLTDEDFARMNIARGLANRIRKRSLREQYTEEHHA